MGVLVGRNLQREALVGGAIGEAVELVPGDLQEGDAAVGGHLDGLADAVIAVDALGDVQRARRNFGSQGLDVTLYIDKKTKLLSRISFSDQGNNVEDYSDYKDVGGIKVAHKRKSTTQGRVTQLDITKVEWDPKIDPAIFKKPAK